jgi:hypothetical protein
MDTVGILINWKYQFWDDFSLTDPDAFVAALRKALPTPLPTQTRIVAVAMQGSAEAMGPAHLLFGQLAAALDVPVSLTWDQYRPDGYHGTNHQYTSVFGQISSRRPSIDARLHSEPGGGCVGGPSPTIWRDALEEHFGMKPVRGRTVNDLDSLLERLEHDPKKASLGVSHLQELIVVSESAVTRHPIRPGQAG